MKQTSPHIEDKLLDFAYGELPSGEAQAVEAHLLGCTACAGALESIQGVRRVMSRLPVEAAPDTGLESLLGYAQQAARRASAGPAPRPTWWRRWVAPLGGLAALVVVGVVYSQVKRSPQMDFEKMAGPGAAVQLAPAAPVVQNDLPVAEPTDQGPKGGRTEVPPEGALEAAPKSVVVHHAVAPAKDAPLGFFQDRREPADDAKKRLSSNLRGAEREVSHGRAAADELAAKEDRDGADKPREKADVRYGNGAEEQDRARGALGGLGVSSGAAVGGGVVSKAPVAVLKNAEGKKAKLARRDEQDGEDFANGPPAETPALAPEPASPPALAADASSVQSQTVARAQPRPVATAATPPPVYKTGKQEESVLEVRSRQADEAHRAHDYVREIQYLKDALVAAGSGPERWGLLKRLCTAELQINVHDACQRFDAEFSERKAMERAQQLDSPEERSKAVPAAKKAKSDPAPAASTTSQ
jgi:hypothetical protein